MTFGNIKFRLTKAFPGVDADLVEGWITDCYQEILGILPWSRLDTQAVLMTTAPYSTGTVAVTQGSATVTLSGGSWTSAMTGIAFHVTGDAEEYQFTYAGPTAGTLDRVYAGSSAAAAGYAIYQSVYPVPANCRFLDDEAFFTFERGPIKRLATEEGERTMIAGQGYPPFTVDTPMTGVPRLWWPYMDDGSTPPQMQVRFFPIPDKVYGIPFTYCAEAPNPTGTSFTLLPWTQPTALIEGSTARIKRHLKDYDGAREATTAYADAVKIMNSQEAYRRGPLQIQLGGYYSNHRNHRGR